MRAHAHTQKHTWLSCVCHISWLCRGGTQLTVINLSNASCRCRANGESTGGGGASWLHNGRTSAHLTGREKSKKVELGSTGRLGVRLTGFFMKKRQKKEECAPAVCNRVCTSQVVEKKEKEEKGKKEKSQRTGNSPAQGFPSVALTSHSRRTSTFSSVQLEGKKRKRERKKEESAGPEQWASLLATAGCCWTRTAAYKLTCLGHFGQQLHQPPVLLVLLAFGLRPATN